MKIISQNNCNVVEIVQALQNGHTLVYPTETCYGLGCDATNAAAVARIFDIKKRQKHKPVLVIMANREMAMEYIAWNPTIERLADRYWPGALTIVAPPNDAGCFAPGILGPRGMAAFRVTSHPFAQELCAALGRPLVSTSANIASLESPYDIQEVLSMFAETLPQPDIVIDAGSLPHESPSTIVRVVDDAIEVLRQGEVIVK
ncbi:MAG: L-threonylcarbamoyladenylate synthase [Patescibacteria group bacterium]